jgi:hypothetical protein
MKFLYFLRLFRLYLELSIMNFRDIKMTFKVIQQAV